MNIDDIRVWNDTETVFADLPEPSTLDDECLELWGQTDRLFERAPAGSELRPCD